MVFHVGDCRVYQQMGGDLRQLTRDDSTAQILVDSGERSAGEIRNDHSLTQALGGRAYWQPIRPHVEVVKIQATSRFLICSDGVTDFLNLKALEAAVLPMLPPIECANRLVESSSKTAQKDNISLIVADVLFTPM